MNRTQNQMFIYNALNDFTAKDQVDRRYKMLMANKLRDRKEEDRLRAFNICLRMAIRDLSVWLIVIVAFVLALIISVQWIG